jgi:hypothetical protein
MIVPTAEEDKEAQFKEESSHGLKSQFKKWIKRQKEDLPEFPDVKTWAIFQLTTFNWLNLAVVLILLISLQDVQQQSRQNATDIKFISGKIDLVNTQLLQSQDLLNQVQKIANFVNSTTIMFSKNANKAVGEFVTLNQNVSSHFLKLNSSASAHIETISRSSINLIHSLNSSVNIEIGASLSNLRHLNESATHLYAMTQERLTKSMTQTYLSSSNGIFSTSVSPSPRFLKVKVIGGGGGGSASSCIAGAPSGNSGGGSTFNNLITADGGEGGIYNSFFAGYTSGGSGRCSTNSAVTGCTVNQGGSGTSGVDLAGSGSFVLQGGIGGIPAYGGLGSWGSGGSGGLYNTFACGGSGYTGWGGGAGGFVEAIIINVQPSYSYSVGGGGSAGQNGGGAPGTSTCGNSASPGINGAIIVEEYF